MTYQADKFTKALNILTERHAQMTWEMSKGWPIDIHDYCVYARRARRIDKKIIKLKELINFFEFDTLELKEIQCQD
jgi:hypothetical protein